MKLLHHPLSHYHTSPTHPHTRPHTQVCEELEQAKQENQTLNNYIDQIVQELSEKTPALQKLRRDYDSSVQTCTSLNQKVDALMDECATLRFESEDSLKSYHSSQREIKRLKALCGDLGRQVKVGGPVLTSC